MATNISPNECGVCNEDYNEHERCPRVLSCSHTLCSECINNLFQTSNLSCPFCREKFKGKNTSDVRVNHAALDFVKFFAKQDRQTPSSPQKDAGPGCSNKRELRSNLLELTNSNMGLCKQSQKRTEKTLSDLIKMQNEVTDENSVLENEILSKVCGIIAQNNKTIERLKQTSLRLQKQTQDMKMKELQLRTIKAQLQRKDHVNGELDDAQVINSFFGEWNADFMDLNTEAKNSIKESQKEMQQVRGKTKSILRILSSAETSDIETDRISEAGPLAIQEDVFVGQITVENLRSMTALVKRLVRDGKVYAGHTRLTNDKRILKTHARISITEDNKLCLHALTEDPLPPSVHVLKHIEVLSLVNPSSPLTFLQIEDVPGERVLGNMYISLQTKAKRAQHFFLLCTGANGESYSKSKVLRVEDSGTNYERIVLGDYEYNNGVGGKCVLNWACNKTEPNSKWLLGLVSGQTHQTPKSFAQFQILTKENSASSIPDSFGIVQEGLRILTEAISNRSDVSYSGQGSFQDLMIGDCGVVLAQNV